MKILSKIKKYLNSWEPVDVFYVSYYRPCTKRTKLGQWFENMPQILSIFKIFYYILACSVWTISNFIWVVIWSFLSKRVKESL